MKISITFVLGMIICNVVCSNGGTFDEYCSIDESVRETVWSCIYRYLPQSEKRIFTQISQCFGVSSFDHVVNRFCGLTDDEIKLLISKHEACLVYIDFDDFDGPTVSESQTTNCVEEKLG